MLPIVAQHPFSLDVRSLHMVTEYARRLRGSRRFAKDAALAPFQVRRLRDAPALVFDDFTDIALFEPQSLYMEQRARLRATAGDIVATLTPADQLFDRYVCNDLGFGPVDWLQVSAPADRCSLAIHCWRDREVRRELVHAIRTRNLRYLHPHMGNSDVWQLAKKLSKAAHRTVSVIGPPPAVAHWANDKVAFSKVASDLLGSRFVPATRSAHSRSLLATQIKELAPSSRNLTIKVPHAAGGHGNFLLDSQEVGNLSLTELCRKLKDVVPNECWMESSPLLVDVWEDKVIESASIQTWIPPAADGEPVLEGIFSQMIAGESGQFVGCIPLQLNDALREQLLESTSILVKLFQLMDYVGRCSFDFLLIGDSLDNAEIEFIECNARWGGTSVPMTVVNRLFGDHANHPFAAVKTNAGDLGRSPDSFAEVQHAMTSELFRRLPGSAHGGWLIPFNPGQLQSHGEMNWIVLGRDLEQVRQRVGDLPGLVRDRITCQRLSEPLRRDAGSKHSNLPSRYTRGTESITQENEKVESP